MPRRFETTDGRYVKVSTTEWWDTSGTETFPEGVVDRYLAENPEVGIVVFEVEDWLEELPDSVVPPDLH